MLHTYYHLAKPGIIYGNLFSLIAGFFLASRGQLDPLLLAATTLGTALIIGSACVYNNVIDRDIDAKMDRTKKRALVDGTVSVRAALLYASILGVLGTITLVLFANVLATSVALFGLFAYVFLYSLWAKRGTHYSTLVGSISGATPPVIGYTAVSGQLDITALLLFLILTAWQMPHFYAIAIHRADEYAAAGIPTVPHSFGIRRTKMAIVLYIMAFAFLLMFLESAASIGTLFRIIMILASVSWLFIALRGFQAADDKVWAKRLFSFSLIVLTTFSLTIVILSLTA